MLVLLLSKVRPVTEREQLRLRRRAEEGIFVSIFAASAAGQGRPRREIVPHDDADAGQSESGSLNNRGSTFLFSFHARKVMFVDKALYNCQRIDWHVPPSSAPVVFHLHSFRSSSLFALLLLLRTHFIVVELLLLHLRLQRKKKKPPRRLLLQSKGWLLLPLPPRVAKQNHNRNESPIATAASAFRHLQTLRLRLYLSVQWPTWKLSFVANCSISVVECRRRRRRILEELGRLERLVFVAQGSSLGAA